MAREDEIIKELQDIKKLLCRFSPNYEMIEDIDINEAKKKPKVK